MAAGGSSRIPVRQGTARTRSPTRAGSSMCTVLPDRLRSIFLILYCRLVRSSSLFSRVARLRGGTGRSYISESFINNTTDCVTASGVRPVYAAIIQIRNCIRIKFTPCPTLCKSKAASMQVFYIHCCYIHCLS